MPAFWIYKCNSKNREYQRAWGDWADVFQSNKAKRWGSTRVIPELAAAKRGDTIIAYQTDRNELVGVARAVEWKREGKYQRLILQPIQKLGVRVRPLKKTNAKIARIPALRPGPIRTLYPISASDARVLLKAAGRRLAGTGHGPDKHAKHYAHGAGFGVPEQNKLVERAAFRHVTRYFRNRGWSIEDVSSKKRGYDLVCKRSGEERHVEVKGARGRRQQFIVTAGELQKWRNDKRYLLAFVGNALSSKPSLLLFPPAATRTEFEFRALCFLASRRPNSRFRAKSALTRASP